MSRRANASHRCPRCRLHLSLCVCDRLPRIETRTKLLLIIHRIEDRKPTNTGRLAAHCLANSEVILRGDEAAPPAPFTWGRETQPVFLFPREGAVPITRFVGSSAPVTLIVPDGTWRQAFKVRKRIPGLSDVPSVSLPPGPPTAYRLRAETQDQGLATIEAIARAFGVLDGPAVQAELERAFKMMVDRTLWARGLLDTDRVTGGIPEGAERHDPRSGQGRERSLA